jgi:hypothetical protein
MSLSEIIDKHIDKVSCHIKKNSRSNPIKSKEEFFNVLKAWRMYNANKGNTAIASENYGRTPLLWLSLNGNYYYLNSDSKFNGVTEFYNNRKNDWKLISNTDGKRNKITNTPDETAIPGFYFYKSL